MNYWPLLNASLNGLSGVCLLFGWFAIRRKDRLLHRQFMLGALMCSSVFLCSYIAYHAVSGSTHYTKTGVLRVIYFSILTTHTPLALLVVPLSLRAVWHAIHGDFKRHVRITRWLFPIWTYVSVTGVIIYLMLYVF